MASDTVQKGSNLLDIEYSHRSAGVRRDIHFGNKKEPGVAMVSAVKR